MMYNSIYFILISIIFSLFISLGSISGLVSFLIFLVLLQVITYSNYFFIYKKQAILIYLVISATSLIVASVYNLSYGYEFGPAADDFTYYKRIEILANNKIPDKYTLFELVVSLYYRVFALFVEPVLLTLLPLNWFITTINVLLVQMLINIISGENKLNILLTACSLILNYHFMDISIHFYRDSFLLLFVISSLIFVYKKKHILSVAMICAAALVRGANGVLSLIAFTIITCFKYFKNQILKILLITILLGGSFFVATEHATFIFNYATTFIGYKQGDKMQDKKQLHEIAADRKKSLLLSGTKKTKINEILYKSDIYYVAKPILTLFFPLTFSSPYHIKNIHIGDKFLPARNIIIMESVFNWFTIIMWVYIGPLLVLGLIDGVRGSDGQKAIIIIFIIWLLLISYLSFQTRHSNAFLVLIPTIMSCANINKVVRLNIARLFFAATIVGINIFSYIKNL